MASFNHIFFDLDHTLWDFEQNSKATLLSLHENFRLVDKGITDFEQFRTIYEAHNERLWNRYRKGYIKRDELRWKRMWLTLLDFKIADLDLANEMSKIYLEILPTQGKLMPFAADVLAYCADKNYNIHLITNGFETTQWQKLKTSGIHHYFDKVITSENSNSMKPKPEIFHFALDATKANAADSIMIGDALEIDVLGAKTVGMQQVFFNPNKIEHNEKPTYEIFCLSELKQIL